MPEFERLRNEYGGSLADRRYISEETPSLDEISDPEKLNDERTQSKREWVSENPRLAALFAVVGMLGVIILVFVTLKYAPATFDMLWQRRGLTFGALGLAIGGVWRSRTMLQRMQSYNQLVVKTSDGQTKRYFGYYLSSDLGSGDLFVPVAGFTYLGGLGDPYRIGDISRDLISKTGGTWDADDPAIILLRSETTAVSHTEAGTVVTTIADGFEPWDGDEANLRCVVPERATKETVKELRNELERAHEQKKFKETMLSKVRSQRDELLDELEKTRDEAIENFIDDYERVEQARHRDRRQSGSSGIGPQPDTPDVEEDLLPNDDD